MGVGGGGSDDVLENFLGTLLFSKGVLGGGGGV